MKRLFTFFTIGLAAMSIVGCNSYEKKASEWICNNVDHFVCPDSERHSLYYLGSTNGWGREYLEKVDLDTQTSEVITSITCDDNTTYNFNTLRMYALPEDKGYGSSTSFVVLVYDDTLPRAQQQAAIAYNTYGGPHKKLCDGRFVKLHGYSLVSRCVITSGSISGVDVFDIEGNKLEPKTYDGTIANQNVVVEFVEKDGYIAGSYYYTKYGPGKYRLYITGTVDKEGNLSVTGENVGPYGGDYLTDCEEWEGTLKNGVVAASAEIAHSRRTYEFTLTERK